MPLSGDQIHALGNALMALKKTLGPEKAFKTPVYTAILRLLKAHVTPLPGAAVSFAQVQAVRLQLLAERLLFEEKEFPKELTAAVAQGLVSGFDPASRSKIPLEQQRAQLANQQLRERNDMVRERAKLQELQHDFQKARLYTPTQPGAALEPGPEHYVPWPQRRFMIPAGSVDTSSFAMLDKETLMIERIRSLKMRTDGVQGVIAKILREHERGEHALEPRVAALLETRARHITLLNLQHRMRQSIWRENQLAERDGRRGQKGRVRTLKQLQREYEKVERSRLRQAEAEERDARRKRQAWMNAMVDHLTKFRSYHRDVVRRGVRAITKAVLRYHEEVVRSASRAEREAEKARIQKLKDDDEEGYLELVKKTKNTRLLELLDQTDKYLRELGAVVKEERVRSGIVEYENSAGGENGVRQDYYEIAHAIKEDVLSQPSLLVGGTLKEYQLQGIQWMLSLYNNRLNGILADEMGLGKTIQTLGLIAHLMERKDNPGPYLIIVPLSTVSNWELEFARWAPAIRVVVFKGKAKVRRRLYEEVIEKNSFNVCLVTYEYVVRGRTFLKRVEWQHLIIDEGHRIKNHESRLSSVLHDHYRSRNRLLLTGTPLQNSLTELWALLNFLLPNVFKSAESFESWFAAPFAQMGVGNIATAEHQAQLTEEESLLIIRRLHQVLRPFLLRRMKSDVLRMGEQLPDKQEHILLCDMSAWQRQMYVKIVKSERILFTDRHGRQRYDKLPNPAIQLRKCVNHPYLFFQDHASHIVDSPELWRASGKFDMLDSIVMKMLQARHRILIFNQMTKVVDLQERLLQYRNIPFYRLDGSTSTDERKRIVNDFNNSESDVNVFLLTTRAGGLGVNLQTADTVIIFDSDWNPSMDQQAQDRAHRIGQRREVLVLRLLTAKSIEEDVMERASFKRGLEKKIIRAGMFDEQSKDSDRQAMLRELLRVEGPVSDDDTEDGLPTEEETNRILARSEEEFDLFMQIDDKRRLEIGSRSRLMVEKEVPEWASKVPRLLREKAKSSGAGKWNSLTHNIIGLNEPKKRRAAATNVSYGVDQLSERQYLKLMERSEAGEEISLTEAMNAMSGGKRRRRRKGANVAQAKEEEEDPDYDRRADSRADSEAGTDTMGSLPHGSPASEAIIASKSLNADMKSYDDDVTEGDNFTGGEHSIPPTGAEDMIIMDDEDDDDDDEAAGDIGEGDEREINEQQRQNTPERRSAPRGRFIVEDASETSEEDNELDRQSRAASVEGKTVTGSWPRSRKRKLQHSGEHDVLGRERVEHCHPRRRRKIALEGSRRGRSRSDSSGDSTSTLRPLRSMRSYDSKGLDREASDGEINMDEISTKAVKRRIDSTGRIPRIQAPKNSTNQSEEKRQDADAIAEALPSEPSENGEIVEGKVSDEAEDGEIREDGELSEEAPNGLRQTEVRRGDVRNTPNNANLTLGIPRIKRPNSAELRTPVQRVGTANEGGFGSRFERGSGRSRFQRVKWFNGPYSRTNVAGSGGGVAVREQKQYGRMPMAQMGRASAAVGVGEDVADVAEDGEIEEEGEIVEN